MTVDYKTVMLYLGGSVFFIIVLFLFYLITTSKRPWFIYTYVISKAILLAAIATVGLRDVVSDTVSVYLGNILLIFAYSSEAYSILSYDEKKRMKLFYFYLVFSVFMSLLFIIFSYNIKIRTFIACSTAAVIYGLCTYVLLKNRGNYVFPLFIGFVLAIYAIMVFIRGIYILVRLYDYVLFSQNNFDFIYFIVALMQISFISIGFLLLLKEKDEKTILTTNTELKESNDYKTKLFRIISHDLKTPMGSMAGVSEILLEKHRQMNPKEREGLIKSIAKCSESLYDILENLLQWSQSEAGELEPYPEEVELRPIVDGIISISDNALQAKQIELKVDISSQEYVIADKYMLNTILRNLVSNAIKFTPRGGSISFYTRMGANDDIQIIVEDNGVGISDEDLENLFKKSATLSHKGTENEKGTGLGLRLCKELVTINNGNIYAKSKLGHGSSFIVELPGSKE